MELAKYQLFIEYIRLVLRLKESADKETYTRLIDKVLDKPKTQNIPDEALIILKSFLVNLKEEDFQDRCMETYLKLQKYDMVRTASLRLEFAKLKLYEQLIDGMTESTTERTI